MKNRRLIKDAIDFEALRKQKASFESDIRIHEKLMAKHQQSSLSLNCSEEAKKKLPEIDALLAKEPPAPELPPCQPLIKVSGVLEEIETLFARGYFTDREYEPEEFARRENSRQWGSVLLAAIGESAASAVHSQDDVRPVREYDFVKGKINGKPFYGWTGRVTAEPGDYIEMAAIEKSEHYEVYAIAIPELRVVSVIPECYQGARSRVISEIKGLIIMTLVLISAVLFFYTVIGDMGFEQLREILILLGSMIGMATLAGLWSYIRSSKKPKPSVLLAQNIFTVLGISEPTKFHLVKHTKKILKEKCKGKKDNKIMPDKNCWGDYYFYY